MAAIHTFQRGRRTGYLAKILVRQPCRTYIPTASYLLHPCNRKIKNDNSFSNSAKRHAPVLCHVHSRYISRDTIAYYLSSDNPPIGLAQQLFENVHSLTGLPWWASIMLTTFGLRSIITIPLAVYTSHMMARLDRLQPELAGIMKQLKAEVVIAKKQHGWSDKEAFRQFKINIKRLTKELYVRDNCHPAKTTILAWVQIPMWISLSLSLRNMAGALPIKGADNTVSASGLDTEGFLWIPNLLLPDSTLIIPFAVGLLNLAIIEMHALRPGTPSRLQRGMTYTLRGISVLMVPIAASVPSCMAFYWACSSFFGLGQNIILKFPTVRRACGIPKLTNESDTPFRDLVTVAREKYSRNPPGKS